MGFIGGLIGIFLGTIASNIISEVGIRTLGLSVGGGVVTAITPQLLIFAMVFSILIGAFSGFFPARRAAKLEPVEALRYE
jgi:putative ABC transport system permease protein